MDPRKRIYLARHGETEWTLSGQHTGTTDIPLTKNGERQAERIGKYLQEQSITSVFTSPKQRARRTCEIAGFLKDAKEDQDLVEWDYGTFEGLTSEEIKKNHPQWTIFSEGAPQGESVSAISSRADRVLAKFQSLSGNILVFSHGHFLRVLAARWLGLSAGEGRLFALAPASISILSFEKASPVIQLWNDICQQNNRN